LHSENLTITKKNQRVNNYLFDKKKGLVFFRVLKRAPPHSTRRTRDKTALFSTRTKKTVEKSFFILSDLKFCFMKRLFYTTLEETMSVASQKKSAVVAGRVLNFGT
jgi:hypothetical protein